MSRLIRQPGWLTATFLPFLMLSACQVTDTNPIVPDPGNAQAEVVEPVPEPGDEELRAWQIEFERQRLIGDLLYDALRALQQDRLLVPVDDNAYTRYRRVLALEPDNTLALEGIQNIVNRYLELAATASRQGRFAAAAEFIDRARAVDRDNPAIESARLALERDRNSGDLVFELDSAQLTAQSPELVEQLAAIASQAVASQAFVWITAPSDEKGRWIYGTLREQANGYRLRGNIELGSFAIIRLRLPASEERGAAAGRPALPGTAD